MGDLISVSPLVAAAGKGTRIGPAGPAAIWAAALEAETSSNWAIVPAPRFNLILKSCRSSSNSEMEFFFIKSMIAFMSFKSTGGLLVGFRRNGFQWRMVSLSKKAVAGSRHCLSIFLTAGAKLKRADSPVKQQNAVNDAFRNRFKSPKKHKIDAILSSVNVNGRFHGQ